MLETRLIFVHVVFFFWFASDSYDDTFFFLVRDVSFLNFQDPNNNLDLHVNDIP